MIPFFSHEHLDTKLLFNAILQALDDMGEGYSVSPAAKRFLEVAIICAETGKKFTYDSRTGQWTEVQ